MNRKKFLKIGVAVVMVVAVVSVTYAYLTNWKSKDNPFSIGYNEIEVREEVNMPDELKPGIEFTKKPSVYNSGTVPCYVRVFAEFSVSDVAPFTSLDFDTANWTEKQPDGYYYYKSILAPGKSTTDLFTKVSIAADADINKMQDFDIIIYAESIQSEGFDDYQIAWSNFIR